MLQCEEVKSKALHIVELGKDERIRTLHKRKSLKVLEVITAYANFSKINLAGTIPYPILAALFFFCPF